MKEFNNRYVTLSELKRQW